MKNKDILQLNEGLANCGNLTGIKFAFAVAKNRKILLSVIEPLFEMIKKLQNDNAKKDEQGKIIEINGQIQMVDLEKFNKEYKELMEVENKISLHKIKIEDLPENISAAQLTSIMEIVEE